MSSLLTFNPDHAPLQNPGRFLSRNVLDIPLRFLILLFLVSLFFNSSCLPSRSSYDVMMFPCASYPFPAFPFLDVTTPHSCLHSLFSSCPSALLSFSSSMLQWRQRHANGNTELAIQLARHFRLPQGDSQISQASCASPSKQQEKSRKKSTVTFADEKEEKGDSKVSKTSDDVVARVARLPFAHACYLSQCLQSAVYETAICHWRRLKEGPAKTMVGERIKSILRAYEEHIKSIL